MAVKCLNDGDQVYAVLSGNSIGCRFRFTSLEPLAMATVMIFLLG